MVRRRIQTGHQYGGEPVLAGFLALIFSIVAVQHN
jgi:hypothetical protein